MTRDDLKTLKNTFGQKTELWKQAFKEVNDSGKLSVSKNVNELSSMLDEGS